MKTLHEKKKRIQKRLHKAEAIEGYLKKAEQDYKEGYYLDSADAARRVGDLDYCHPEHRNLTDKANAKANESRPRRKYENKPKKQSERVTQRKTVKAEVTPVISSSTTYHTSCSSDSSEPGLATLNWIIYIACAVTIGFLLYCALSN